MRDCKHGRLARVCEICERDEKIAKLEAKLTKLEAKEIALLTHCADVYEDYISEKDKAKRLDEALRKAIELTLDRAKDDADYIHMRSERNYWKARSERYAEAIRNYDCLGETGYCPYCEQHEHASNCIKAEVDRGQKP